MDATRGLVIIADALVTILRRPLYANKVQTEEGPV